MAVTLLFRRSTKQAPLVEELGACPLIVSSQGVYTYVDREKLLEIVEALRQLGPEDLKDSRKAEGLVLGFRSGKRKPKS